MSKRIWTIQSVGLLLALSAPALANDGIESLTPITDPVLLARLGAAPDATNVYATPQALRELTMGPAEQHAIYEAVNAYEAELETTSAFGTSTVGHSSIIHTEFYPSHGYGDYASDLESRWCVDGDAVFRAQFDSLPHGARLHSVNFWGYDDSDESMTVIVRRTCLPDSSAGEANHVVLGSVESFTSAGY